MAIFHYFCAATIISFCLLKRITEIYNFFVLKATVLIKHFGQLAIFGSIAALLFYLLYQGQDWKVIGQDIASSSPWWIGASIAISLAGHYARGWRWMLMLSPLGYHVSSFKAFLAVMVGYLVNIPTARLGEVARCALLQKNSGVPMEASLGAIVAERLIDLLVLLSLTLFTILVEFDKIGRFVLEKLQQVAENFSLKPTVMLFVWLPATILLLLLVWFWRKKLYEISVFKKVGQFVIGLKNGFLAILKLPPRQQLVFLLLTVLIWMSYFLMSYVLFFSQPHTSFLGLRCALAVLVMSGLGVTIPTPGGVGSYHLFVIFTLTSYGLAEDSAKSFAFLMHSSQLLSVTVFGFLSLLASSFYTTKKNKHQENSKSL